MCIIPLFLISNSVKSIIQWVHLSMAIAHMHRIQSENYGSTNLALWSSTYVTVKWFHGLVFSVDKKHLISLLSLEKYFVKPSSFKHGSLNIRMHSFWRFRSFQSFMYLFVLLNWQSSNIKNKMETRGKKTLTQPVWATNHLTQPGVVFSFYLYSTLFKTFSLFLKDMTSNSYIEALRMHCGWNNQKRIGW